MLMEKVDPAIQNINCQHTCSGYCHSYRIVLIFVLVSQSSKITTGPGSQLHVCLPDASQKGGRFYVL